MDHRRSTRPSILASEGDFFVIQLCPLCERYLGLGQAKSGVSRSKIPRYGSVDISTTNAPIEDRTKGHDSLRCNLPLANGIKKLLSFQILRHQ